jgi:hypothetical protein
MLSNSVKMQFIVSKRLDLGDEKVKPNTEARRVRHTRRVTDRSRKSRFVRTRVRSSSERSVNDVEADDDMTSPTFRLLHIKLVIIVIIDCHCPCYITATGTVHTVQCVNCVPTQHFDSISVSVSSDRSPKLLKSTLLLLSDVWTPSEGTYKDSSVTTL